MLRPGYTALVAAAVALELAADGAAERATRAAPGDTYNVEREALLREVAAWIDAVRDGRAK